MSLLWLDYGSPGFGLDSSWLMFSGLLWLDYSKKVLSTQLSRAKQQQKLKEHRLTTVDDKQSEIVVVTSMHGEEATTRYKS